MKTYAMMRAVLVQVRVVASMACTPCCASSLGSESEDGELGMWASTTSPSSFVSPISGDMAYGAGSRRSCTDGRRDEEQKEEEEGGGGEDGVEGNAKGARALQLL